MTAPHLDVIAVARNGVLGIQGGKPVNVRHDRADKLRAELILQDWRRRGPVPLFFHICHFCTFARMQTGIFSFQKRA
ncbi:MAG: hypothetical protein MZV63_04555 [Marinilabiliales bacterium]|nr:hypothetical protein [Marinilabiliales bacterium]